MGRLRTPAVLGLALLLLAGSTVGLYYALRPDFCDGLPREIGACSRNRPAFTGASCEDVGGEWGRQLDERVVPLIQRPFSGVSSKLLDVEILTIGLAHQHMEDKGITPGCTPDAFFTAGEQHFSGTFKSGVGNVVYEGDPVVAYEEWVERTMKLVGLNPANP